MFEGVGKNRDEEALKRSAQSVIAAAVLTAVTAAAAFAWVTYQAARYVVEEVLEVDDEMVEVVMEDVDLGEAPPPPPPPPPPPAASEPEPEEEEIEEETEPTPDEMVEEVEELEEEVEEEVKKEVVKGVEGGVEGGEEGGVVGGVIGGVEGGVIGGQLGGARTFHHSEVQVKRRVSPHYPDSAKDLNLGDVSCKVRIFIDDKGVPYDIAFEACPKVFHASAEDALMKWRWYPAKFEGNKVKAQFLLNIKYKLK